ncbi:MAG: aminotransferase class V-fold PLP-dependent enzyme [Armatimonadetes bacterium]|nr:aminotransferase class V-fold PLP-dependent enzyme [Armatimonadota bacterium]
MVYLDHAATVWPRPAWVMEAMQLYMAEAGSPGRSGHRLSITAGRMVYEAREAIADLFGAADPLRVIFTRNATEALNLALTGLLKPGDRVVTTGVEHNAVARPLFALKHRGVSCDVVPCDRAGVLDLAALKDALMRPVRVVAINHASNVSGTLAPLELISPLVHEAGALLLVDAAQTAGALPIDMGALGIDMLAFTGHKGLMGPQGTGGLVIGKNADPGQIEPLTRGGTGSRSELEDQPDALPDRFESGTLNGVGIAGLGASVRKILEIGVDAIRAHDMAITQRLLERLGHIPGVRIHGPCDPKRQTATVSVTFAEHVVTDIAFRLDDEFGVMVRAGLHCAPWAHRSLGTLPQGTLRLSAGFSTTVEDIDRAIEALNRVVNA